MNEWKVRQREDFARRLSQALQLRNQAVKAARSRCEWFSCLPQDGVGAGKLGWCGGRDISAFNVSPCLLAPGHPG